MLRATFLGHQGWLLSTGRTNILIDPLLTGGFGHGAMAGTVFPPREFELERMPRIDAAWLTHEHDDHFDLASLTKLDRSVPVYASARSSVALFEVLGELGFDVRPVVPETTVEISDLSIRTFVADHRATPLADEWDVLPLLATDAAGCGAFASSVDVAMPNALLDAVSAMPDRRWLLCLANNTTDVRFVRQGIGRVEPTDDTDALASVLTRRWRQAAERAGAPAFTTITGGGWSHPEDVGWIDRIAFCIDPGRLAAALSDACHARVSACSPGDVIELGETGVREVHASWIRTVELATRPSRRIVDVPDDIGPASGHRRLRPGEWTRLEVGLRELARFLFARPVFIAAHTHPGHHPFSLWLRDDGGDRSYAWRPSAAAFEPDDQESTSGLRVWSTDLLGLLEGSLAPSAICYTGRVRCWNHAPEQLRVSPQLLWRFAHPLHRPQIARRLYDRLVNN